MNESGKEGKASSPVGTDVRETVSGIVNLENLLVSNGLSNLRDIVNTEKRVIDLAKEE